MEKKNYDLCLEVLRRMKGECLLDNILLAGSWCVLLYEDYFEGECILPTVLIAAVLIAVPVFAVR